jgi:hypothetical protein
MNTLLEDIQTSTTHMKKYIDFIRHQTGKLNLSETFASPAYWNAKLKSEISKNWRDCIEFGVG